ncbi:hypothetical protein CC80DRAFT_531512 [Byssothecium circinans]|uniref:Uncharacterized protein n=1 Tax=Byssothecium circinans TaxID=147558 RepID=A0A6A5UBF6_9PLEO|nr:hypothetical protein CC80DRAFT_531512 [Byssothecium circinans]
MRASNGVLGGPSVWHCGTRRSMRYCQSDNRIPKKEEEKYPRQPQEYLLIFSVCDVCLEKAIGANEEAKINDAHGNWWHYKRSKEISDEDEERCNKYHNRPHTAATAPAQQNQGTTNSSQPASKSAKEADTSKSSGRVAAKNKPAKPASTSDTKPTPPKPAGGDAANKRKLSNRTRRTSGSAYGHSKYFNHNHDHDHNSWQTPEKEQAPLKPKRLQGLQYREAAMRQLLERPTPRDETILHKGEEREELLAEEEVLERQEEEALPAQLSIEDAGKADCKLDM